MTTDCPNCSWLFETNNKSGDKIICPFCSSQFMLFDSPFDQLHYFLQAHYSEIENGPFFDYSCSPNKDFSGWISHRIRYDQPGDIFKLYREFTSAVKAKIIIESLWNFNLMKYLDLSDEAGIDFLAVWLYAGLIPRDSPMNLSGLIAEHLWNYQISIQNEFVRIALDGIKKDPLIDSSGVGESDLTLEYLKENPIFDWGKDAPLAFRRQLIVSLSQAYCYGRTVSSYFRLDKCWSSVPYSGADHGYTTQKLLDSNIFCEVLEDKYEKLFSKDELIVFMNELQLPVKKSFTRRKMVAVIMDSPEGSAKLKELVADKNYVMIHPSLEKYAREMVDHHRDLSLIMRAFSALEINKNYSAGSFTAYAGKIALMLEEYLRGMKIADVCPAWRYHAVCPEHQHLNEKVFLKTDPIWRKIFPVRLGECCCYVEETRKLSELSRGEDFDLPPRDFADPVKILESWQNDPAPLIPLPKEDPTP